MISNHIVNILVLLQVTIWTMHWYYDKYQYIQCTGITASNHMDNVLVLLQNAFDNVLVLSHLIVFTKYLILWQNAF